MHFANTGVQPCFAMHRRSCTCPQVNTLQGREGDIRARLCIDVDNALTHVDQRIIAHVDILPPPNACMFEFMQAALQSDACIFQGRLEQGWRQPV